MRKPKSIRIGLSGHILVPDHDLESVITALPEHIRLTRAEDGCVFFEVTQDPQNPNRFDVREEYTDKYAFEFHQARLAATPWAEITRNVTRHYQKTEIPV